MMRSDQLKKLTIVAVAGLACSAAMAQKQASKVAAPATVQTDGGVKSLGAKTPIPAMRAVRLHRDGSVSDASDVQVYNNGDFTVLPPDGYFSFANTSRVQEDAGLNAGPGAGPGVGTTVVNRVIKTVTVAIATTAAPNPLDTPDVVFNWYNTYTPGAGAATPVAGPLSGGFRVTVNPPAGPGWAANTIYFLEVDLTVLPLTPFTILNDLGTAEVAIYAGTVGTTPNTNFNVGFYDAGNTIGNSQISFHFDNNNDGIIAQAEAFIATSNPTEGLRPRSTMVLSMVSNLDSGACCLPNGTCIVANATSCTRLFGTYGGDDSVCGTCDQPGACALPDGSCMLTSSAQCTGLFGAYKGNGSNCADAICSGPTVLFNNGPLSTGNTSFGGAAAPAGSTWSEVSGVTGCTNTSAGSSSGAVGANFFRLADNFTVPVGETWTINSVDTFAYQTGSTPAASPFTGASFNLQIWDGPPGVIATSTVVYGDTFTNRLSATVFSNMYRIFFNAPGTTRPIYKNTLTLTPPAVLTAGTYYLDWQTGTPTTTAAHFSPTVANRANRGMPGRDAFQRVPAGVGNDWVAADDVGSIVDCGEGIVRVEFPFIVNGSKTGTGPGCTPAGCYANCDGSTSAPVLNANDFNCFLNKYAASDPYANCDGSTSSPVLNANDFNCFLNKYAAGCT